MERFSGSRPWWVTLLVALIGLTAVSCPLMIRLLPEEMRYFVLLYPLYAIISCVIAWKIYPTGPDIFWVLVILAWISFGLMWLPLIL